MLDLHTWQTRMTSPPSIRTHEGRQGGPLAEQDDQPETDAVQSVRARRQAQSQYSPALRTTPGAQ